MAVPRSGQREERAGAKLVGAIKFTSAVHNPGAGTMEADHRQVSTVFTVRHSTIGTRQTQYHEALPSSANDEVRCDCTFTDDGNAS